MEVKRLRSDWETRRYRAPHRHSRKAPRPGRLGDRHVHNSVMPERLVTGLTQGVIKFGAGDDQRREQVSSTWYVRVTRGMEIYVLNREAGGNRAHISFHKDGCCHYKVEDPTAKFGDRKVAEWELPPPIEETGMLRLATVVIPHRGLVVPENFEGVDPETVLIPQPITSWRSTSSSSPALPLEMNGPAKRLVRELCTSAGSACTRRSLRMSPKTKVSCIARSLAPQGLKGLRSRRFQRRGSRSLTAFRHL